MKKNLMLFAIGTVFCTTLSAQQLIGAKHKLEYQDPAIWISLEQNNKGIPVSVVPRKNQLPVMYSVPIKFMPKKDDNLSVMDMRVGLIRSEIAEDGRQIVHFNGKLDLSCCRNRPVNMEFYDDEDNLIQFARTDEDGVFKLKSVNGNLLEIKNYKLKVNFDYVKTIDENWDERFARLERTAMPDEKKLEKMQKKQLRAINKLDKQDN